MPAAKEYSTDRIRNVAVLGHGASGKTSLVDALAFVAGTSKRHGNVKEGHALTYFRNEEKAHGISMYVTPAYAEWKDVKINLLDTPGYLDFAGEPRAAARVADAAVIVVAANVGVEVGTEKVWGYCDDRSLPRTVFISMMDKEHANFAEVFADVKARLSDRVVAVELPIGEGDEFRGVVNLFSGKAHIFKEGTVGGEFTEEDVPADMADRFEEARTELMETIATTDETLLERYLETGEIPADEVLSALRTAMMAGDAVPVFCGAAEKTYGMRTLLDKMVQCFPSPADMPAEKISDGMELEAKDDGPLAALVFKITSEAHVGEMFYFRVFSGSIENGADVYNPDRKAHEKMAHLSIPMGKDRLEVDRLHAGDIGVIARLKETRTNDTLTTEAKPVKVPGVDFPKPDSAMAVSGATRADDDKMGQGLQRLQIEDPTFTAAYDPELKQTIARGLGELHLEVQFEKLRERYGIELKTEPPKIAFRETIRKEARAQGRHKKQTGGKGQFGDCHVVLRPRARGEGYNFIDAIKGGVIPAKFIPAVDKGIQEASQKGILAGYPLVDFEAEVYDGSFHAVDSSEMAFKIAGSLAYQKASEAAAPVILEPVMQVEVVTPNEYVGDIMGDITQRRGRVLGMDAASDRTVINAVVPQAELFRYASSLRSMTQGRGHHTRKFHAYEEVPQMEADKIIAKRKAELEEE